MTRIILLAFTVTAFSGWSQMPVSEELGKHDGLPGLSIDKPIPVINGITEITREESEANFFESAYVETKVFMVDPVAIKYTSVYGLPVTRIEVLGMESYSDDGETQIFTVSGIAVFLALPKTNETLRQFIDKFTAAYAPELDVMGFTEEMVPLMQWHSSNECGAMMSLPMLFSLEEYKEHEMKQLEIRFSTSCGG